MSNRSIQHKRREDRTALPPGQDPRLYHLHSSHSDPASRTLRAPRDTSRRSSRLTSVDDRLRTPSSSSHESGRARHWEIILGGQPVPMDTSHSPSPTDMSAQQQPALPPRSRSATAPVASRRRAASTNNFDTTSRTPRAPPPKPFGCQQCERRFERIGHLRSHVDAVHNLRQPYVCTVNGCGKTFSHRSSLYRHIKGVHDKHRHQDKSNGRNYRQGPPGEGSYGLGGFIGTPS